MADFLEELHWFCCYSVLCLVSLCVCSLAKNTNFLVVVFDVISNNRKHIKGYAYV